MPDPLPVPGRVDGEEEPALAGRPTAEAAKKCVSAPSCSRRSCSWLRRRLGMGRVYGGTPG